MADYVYTVDSNNYKRNDSMTIEVGDSFKIVSSSPYGASSTKRSSPSGLRGDFPPEIPKTSVYWEGYDYIFEMKNPVILNTAGTYTFGKTRANYSSVGGYLTLNVIARQTPTIPVNVSGMWKDATPYVNVNGTWKDATPYVNVGGTWKETN